MNIFEVLKKENIGKVYEIFIDGESKGRWEIEEVGEDDFDFYNEGDQLGEIYFASQIVKMEFREVIDWSKVPVDTPIWVRDNEELDWFPRHFAKYENGIVYTWASGKTSHTIGNPIVKYNEWKYAKLYQE